MSDYQIIEMYDSTNVSLGELSRLTGRSIGELKALLMETNKGY